MDVKNNFNGGMNLDDSFHLLPKNTYADALNVTRNALAGSNDEVLTNIIGNRLVPYTFQAGTVKCIGSLDFILRNTTINFIYNSNGYHTITEYNNTTRTITKIFESRTDSAGIDILNFTADGKIKNINIYPRDEGDLLFFLDSLGRPTGLDITKFKSGEYTPVTRELIDKAKMPPLSPPSVVYDNDISVRSNNLTNKLFRFKYRWIYDDLEKSTFSPISIVTLPVSVLSDIYTSVITNNNVIRLVANNGGKNVKSVEIGMSYVDKTNDWSDFQSVQVVQKIASTLTQSSIISEATGTTQIYTAFAGGVAINTTINVYLTLLPNTTTLVGSYTTTGYTVNNIVQGLIKSMVAIGIVATPAAFGNGLVYFFPTATYAFQRVDIISSGVVEDNFDFSFPFYNDSTYPDIDISESIQLFDYVPDIALVQGMPNGDTLIYGGITEGYDKNTVENAIITVGTIAASNGGAIGNLSATTIRRADIGFTYAVEDATFSGIPATGTVINLKLKRKSDHTIITGATYTTIAGDTVYSIVNLINYTAPNAIVIARTGATVKSRFELATYEAFPSSTDYMQVEIVPPSTTASTNSIPTWKWSTQRNIARAYFDEHGKTNGILYTDKVVFPAYNENGSNSPLLPYINYKINDVPPDWAYSMQFLFTKEGTQYIYWQSLTVQKETAYIYFEVTSFITNAAKKPTTAIVCSYSFKDGDRLRLIRNMAGDILFPDTYNAAIEGLVVEPVISGVTQTGKSFVKIKNVEPFTSGMGSGSNYVIELFNPGQPIANMDNLAYYELGRQYAILDPTLSTRRHSGEVTNQVVGTTPAEYNFYAGDAYFRARTIAATDDGYATFDVMDRNFVDFYISAVSSVDGRPNEIDINAKRQKFGATFRFGQSYQANTNINGLNRFYEDNLMDVDYGFGDIVRVTIRARYIKCFQELKIGIIPIYGQIQKSATGAEVLVVTDKLLNPVQYRIGNLGLTTPESLASWHFADYGCDIPKGIIWRDSDDGVEPISELHKVDSWATIELPLRSNGSKIYGAIDPKKNAYVAALEAYVFQLPYFSISAIGLNSISSPAFQITSTSDFSVDWGDGTVDTFLAGTRNPTHAYGSPFTGTIKVESADLENITSLTISGDSAMVNPTINPISGGLTVEATELQKLSGLLTLVLGDAIFLDGIVSYLPAGLTFIVVTQTNLSGSVLNLPRTLTHINIQGANTLSGNVTQLPASLVYFLLYGSNTLTGDVAGFASSVSILLVNGLNTLYGDVSTLPAGLTQLQIIGFTTITGNVSGFPSTLTNIVIYGNNTISGNISAFPSGCVGISILGVNTITGTVQTMPAGVVFIQITGNNSLSGNLALVPSVLQFINFNSPNCSVNDYTASVRTWHSTMDSVKVVPVASGFSATEVDNILIELAAQATTWTGDKLITLTGASAARTAASNAAVTTLTGRGVTITTN